MFFTRVGQSRAPYRAVFLALSVVVPSLFLSACMSSEKDVDLSTYVDQTEPADSSTAPVPSLSRADDVVSDVRAAGLDVELEVHGTPRELPRALDLSAYRILQEALTNVLRHAPGSCARVRLDYTREGVDIRVRDDGRGHAPSGLDTGAVGGHGLVGMRERAQMFGGTLEAAPVDGGFEVRAHLPTSRSRV